MTGKDGDRVGWEITAPFPAGLLGSDNALLESIETAEAELRADIAAVPGGSAVVVVKRGPNAGARFLLDSAVSSAGRHPNSDIFLDDVTASRRHVEFRRENDEYWIIDVGSLNGTYVNHKPVQSAVLADGDEIQIGNFRLVFLTVPASR